MSLIPNDNIYVKGIGLFFLLLFFSCNGSRSIDDHEEVKQSLAFHPFPQQENVCDGITPLPACKSLILLYHANLDSFAGTNWFSGEENMCKWSGITCNDRNQIESLELRNMNLKVLPADSFLGLPDLYQIDLSSNQISQIESNTFSGLAHLETLYFSSSGVQEIKSNAFLGLSHLITLDLSDNQISQIEVNSFAGLFRLQDLFLSSNQISKMEANSFANLTSLQGLFLNQNHLQEIKLNTFSGLSHLMTLNLSLNQISKIETNSFANLTSLQDLFLNSNQLSTLEPNMFTSQTLDQLQYLNVRFNQLIKTVDKAFFYNCNSASDSHERCIPKFPKLQIVHFDHNLGLTLLPRLLCDHTSIELSYENTLVMDCR